MTAHSGTELRATSVPRALAYVLRGSWVAACPRDDCANVEFLDARQHPPARRHLIKSTRDLFHCTYCLMTCQVEWPSNADELMEPLLRRPVPKTRNWYPAEHPEAITYGIEHGQSVNDLWEENRAHGVE